MMDDSSQFSESVRKLQGAGVVSGSDAHKLLDESIRSRRSHKQLAASEKRLLRGSSSHPSLFHSCHSTLCDDSDYDYGSTASFGVEELEQDEPSKDLMMMDESVRRIQEFVAWTADATPSEHPPVFAEDMILASRAACCLQRFFRRVYRWKEEEKDITTTNQLNASIHMFDWGGFASHDKKEETLQLDQGKKDGKAKQEEQGPATMPQTLPTEKQEVKAELHASIRAFDWNGFASQDKKESLELEKQQKQGPATMPQILHADKQEAKAELHASIRAFDWNGFASQDKKESLELEKQQKQGPATMPQTLLTEKQEAKAEFHASIGAFDWNGFASQDKKDAVEAKEVTKEKHTRPQILPTEKQNAKSGLSARSKIFDWNGFASHNKNETVKAEKVTKEQKPNANAFDWNGFASQDKKASLKVEEKKEQKSTKTSLDWNRFASNDKKEAPQAEEEREPEPAKKLFDWNGFASEDCAARCIQRFFRGAIDWCKMEVLKLEEEKKDVQRRREEELATIRRLLVIEKQKAEMDLLLESESNSDNEENVDTVDWGYFDSLQEHRQELRGGIKDYGKLKELTRGLTLQKTEFEGLQELARKAKAKAEKTVAKAEKKLQLERAKSIKTQDCIIKVVNLLKESEDRKMIKKIYQKMKQHDCKPPEDSPGAFQALQMHSDKADASKRSSSHHKSSPVKKKNLPTGTLKTLKKSVSMSDMNRRSSDTALTAKAMANFDNLQPVPFDSVLISIAEEGIESKAGRSKSKTLRRQRSKSMTDVTVGVSDTTDSPISMLANAKAIFDNEQSRLDSAPLLSLIEMSNQNDQKGAAHGRSKMRERSISMRDATTDTKGTPRKSVSPRKSGTSLLAKPKGKVGQSGRKSLRRQRSKSMTDVTQAANVKSKEKNERSAKKTLRRQRSKSMTDVTQADNDAAPLLNLVEMNDGCTSALRRVDSSDSISIDNSASSGRSDCSSSSCESIVSEKAWTLEELKSYRRSSRADRQKWSDILKLKEKQSLKSSTSA